MAYPKLFRQKALDALRGGHNRKDVNEMLGLANTTLRDWEILERETGSLENRPLNRKQLKIDLNALQEYCDKNLFATHLEAAAHFECSESGIRKAKKKLGITRKKTHHATQSEANKNEQNILKS